MSKHIDTHVSAERMQAFLEGDLPTGERSPIEEHLASCVRCSAELDGWRVLFADLAGLAAPAPRAGFADRVMAGVEISAPVPLGARLAARVRAGVAALSPRARPGHVEADVLQDFVEGLLPARRVARVRAHVDTCSTCAHELESWRVVMGTLGRLERYAPSEAFAARVLAAVRAPAAVPVAARAVASTTAWDYALVVARRFVPRTRRAWAALSGFAVTPAAIFGLVLYAVFSHPTLTPQALASFALWQLTDLFALGWNAVVGVGLEAASLLGADSLFDLVVGSPLVVAGGALAYSAVAAVALRVLYTNLITNRRYAHVSTR